MYHCLKGVILTRYWVRECTTPPKRSTKKDLSWLLRLLLSLVRHPACWGVQTKSHYFSFALCMLTHSQLQKSLWLCWVLVHLRALKHRAVRHRNTRESALRCAAEGQKSVLLGTNYSDCQWLKSYQVLRCSMFRWFTVKINDRLWWIDCLLLKTRPFSYQCHLNTLDALPNEEWRKDGDWQIELQTYLPGHIAPDLRLRAQNIFNFQYTSLLQERSAVAQWSPRVISTENRCQSGNVNHSTSVHRLIQCRRHTHGHPHRHVRRLKQEQPTRNSQSVGVEVPNSFRMIRT